MADAKIITYGELISATTDVIPDSQTVAMEIESTDGKEYVQIDTATPAVVMGQKVRIDTEPTGNPTASDNADDLVIRNDGGAARITILGGTSTYGQTMYGDKDDVAQASIGWHNSNADLDFRTYVHNADMQFKAGNDQLSLYLEGGSGAPAKIATGGETSALCAPAGLHLKIADSGLAAPNGSFDDLVIEHSGATGLTFSAPANSGIRFQKDGNTDHHGITFDSGTSSIRTRLGAVDRLYIDDAGRVKWQSSGVQYHAGTGNDDAATEPLYLTGSGANLIIDCRKGNYGDVTLTANVTAVKFLFRPDDGNVFTMTAKIKQGSSVYEIDYSDSAVTVYAGDGTGSASTGEMKWSGNVPHTIGAVNTIDIVQFTIFPNGTTFDVFAAVIGQDFS